MPKPLELPPEVARNFVRNMHAYFAEKNPVKPDKIAARQVWLLGQHLGRRNKELRIVDVIEMFQQMQDEV